jgi:predicted phage baseplate assembly protein
LVEYAVTGKATGIQLKELEPKQQTELQKFRRRNTTVYIQSEKLELARKFDETPVQGNFIELEEAVPGLKKGQVVIIVGETLDETGKPDGKKFAELRRLREVTTNKIFFDTDLEYRYLRESVRINANVAMATHGETRSEVLGSGDPTQSQQSFTLKQKPLTFIKASTPTGVSSTLQVRVDDILWKQVDYLYDTSPNDRVFVTRNEDDGSTVIIFGDGKRGSRPNIGTENIIAKYRIGTGKAGLLKQNQLSLLIDRPLGIKSVTNPFPTTAADDPENLESAKTNASLKVLTIDRIVSESDFENYARSFAGIGKAKASEIWNGSELILHLTVASASGKRLDPKACENITKSIKRFKDPLINFKLDSFIRKPFSLTAKIKIRDDMLPEKVLLSVRNLILDTFSFEKRQFGQPVTLSEVVTLIQNIEGVTFVDLDELHIDDPKLQQTKLEKYLACSSAEMLVINPQGVKLLAVG